MTERLQLYKCKICSNLVQVILDGQGELVCCNEPMTLVSARTNDDEFGEKHVPVFDKDENGNDIIKVGSIAHPMIEEHYIQFIEGISKDKKYIALKYLYPNEEPIFNTNETLKPDSSIEYCNIHGLWGNERGENDK